MTCSRCGKDVGNNMLTCIACALEINDQAIRRHQYEGLLMVEAGKGPLKGYRCADSVLHVRMFGSDACFCGRPAEAPAKRRSDIYWGTPSMSVVCGKCRTAIDAILAEAKAASAMTARRA